MTYLGLPIVTFNHQKKYLLLPWGSHLRTRFKEEILFLGGWGSFHGYESVVLIEYTGWGSDKWEKNLQLLRSLPMLRHHHYLKEDNGLKSGVKMILIGKYK